MTEAHRCEQLAQGCYAVFVNRARIKKENYVIGISIRLRQQQTSL